MNFISKKYYAVVVAAGAGRRMGGDIPKQYLPLAHRPILEWSIRPFLHLSTIERVIVVLAADDTWFSGFILAQHPKITTVVGGQERVESVMAGLEALRPVAEPDDWVLVHDGARPNLALADLQQLISKVANHPVGGVLGTPISDSLKRVDSQNAIVDDCSREALWRAFTPQLFRYQLLLTAHREAGKQGVAITDEASAVLRSGQQPLMVAGRSDNIKVTTPADYELMQKLISVNEEQP